MWIKPFRAAGEYYVYSAWSNAINRTSHRLYECFAKGSDEDSSDERRRLAAALGLLPDRTVPLEVFPESVIRAALSQLRREGPARLVMTITEACNFRCSYCVYSGAYAYARPHGSRSIPVETALKALHWYFGFRRGSYRIGFYGGEPLLQRRLIERVVEEARKAVPRGARLSFSMTTNGWLLDDVTIGFLADNEFDLFVSLDGPARVHDRYRRTVEGQPTFHLIWDRVKRIRKLHPRYFAERVNFCMILAPPDRLEEVVEFVGLNGDVFSDKVPVILTLNDAPLALYEALNIGAGENRVNLIPVREQYLSQLALGEKPDGVSRALNEAAMARFARRSMTSPATLTIPAGQCVPGARCHVTPDGTLHACERVDPCLSIGQLDTGYDEPRIEALLKRFADLVQTRCKDCWAVRLCRKCLADIAEGPSLSSDRLSEICACRLRELERDLIDYCRARSQDDHCFDSLALDRNDSDNPPTPNTGIAPQSHLLPEQDGSFGVSL